MNTGSGTSDLFNPSTSFEINDPTMNFSVRSSPTLTLTSSDTYLNQTTSPSPLLELFLPAPIGPVIPSPFAPLLHPQPTATTSTSASQRHAPPPHVRGDMDLVLYRQQLLQRCYSDTNPRVIHLRSRLQDVLDSNWWTWQLMEPPSELNKFLKETSSGGYQCTVCLKECQRLPRGIEHFRSHINHRPFACSDSGGCGETNWYVLWLIDVDFSLMTVTMQFETFLHS